MRITDAGRPGEISGMPCALLYDKANTPTFRLKKGYLFDILERREESSVDMRRPRRFLDRGNYEKSMCNFTIKQVCFISFLYK